MVDERRLPSAELECKTADCPNIAQEVEETKSEQVLGCDPEVFFEVYRIWSDVGEEDLDQQLVAVVCELGFTVCVDEYVGGFDVAG